MLLLYHQNLEKKTVKSTQNIFIRSIGFFICQGSCPCKASAAKKKMQKQECILYACQALLCHNHREKQNISLAKKAIANFSPACYNSKRCAACTRPAAPEC